LAERSVAPTLTVSPDAAHAAAVSIGVRPTAAGAELLPEARELVARYDVDAVAELRREAAKGEAGEVVRVSVNHADVEALLLTGLGDESRGSLRKAAAAVATRASAYESASITWTAGRDATVFRAVAEAAALASYRFTRASEPKPRNLARIVLATTDGADDALRRAEVTVAAVSIARDLANTPSLEKSPQWLADRAVEVAAASGLTAQVWDEDRLRKDGFGGVLAVGRGSARPPLFVRLDYAPKASQPTRHVVLVGKGITFDSGGLSLKPPEGMPLMKTDMSGAAAVIGAMSALRALDVRSRVTALLPMAENMPGADATRPSDVVRHYDGRTSEVLNTDAEGRIVLADALGYAVRNLQPDVIVDIATLTGAASIGLGRRHGALYSTDAVLAGELVVAADAGGERLWPMPLVETYLDTLESPVADLRNIGDPGDFYGGGSIVAALFLREFVGSVPWAHLDVAGPARAEADEDDLRKGATGFGVRTFLRWLDPA
jgi:leucyl aminopeptidase